MNLYKDNESDIISYVDDPDTLGEILFTFDGVKVYNFWIDYPDNMTPEEVTIFKKENPNLALLKAK